MPEYNISNIKLIRNPEIEEFKQAIDSRYGKKLIFTKMNINRLRQGLGIILRQSFVIPGLINNYFYSFRGKYPLRSLEVAIGYDCNFSCSQCSCALNRDTKRTRLSLNEFKNTIDQAIDMGAFQFNLNGGEPMLYFEEVKELCSYIRKRNCYVHMATNGFFFTFERIKEMHKAGLNSFEMGLDSSVEKIHDANRGKGSYQKIMDNAIFAQSLGLKVAFNTVGTKEKIYNGDLLNTAYLARKLGVLLMITPPCVTGHWRGKLEVLLNEEEKWYIRWLLSMFKNTRIDNYNGLKKISCPAGREKLAVNPYGDVVSCPLIQIVYGNIKNDTLVSIQKKILKDKFYLKGFDDGCLPSHDINFINERLINYRDSINN
ncbi:MAG: radical SAM protein [Candidatus Omnitrophota bacterium]